MKEEGEIVSRTPLTESPSTAKKRGRLAGAQLDPAEGCRGARRVPHPDADESVLRDAASGRRKSDGLTPCDGRRAQGIPVRRRVVEHLESEHAGGRQLG